MSEMRKSIEERLRRVIRENFSQEIEEFTNDSECSILEKSDFAFGDIGFDSMIMMMLFTILEEEFDIVVEDEDLTLDFELFSSMVDYLVNKTAH